mgnify:CR=1 FL=1
MQVRSNNPNGPDACRAPRRGMVLIVLLVLFAISMTLFGLWAQSAVREHQRMTMYAYRMQSVRLAESGLARAVARIAADPQYDGETWMIPAADLGGKHAAEVRIRITPATDAARLHVEAVAEYPAGAVRRAQVTQHRDIPNPTSGNES